MTVKINHSKASGKAAGTDSTRVYGTHWDADHTVIGAAALDGGNTFTGGTQAINPPASSTTQGLAITQSPAGTITGGSPFVFTTANALNYVNVTSDTVDIGDNNEYSAFGIIHKSGGPSVLGMRSGLHVEQWLTADTNPSETETDIVAGTFQVYGQAGNRAAGGAAYTGLNSVAYLLSSATNAGGLTGLEIEIITQVGSTVQNRFGINIITPSGDTSQGYGEDVGIAFYNGGTSGGWKKGINFTPSTVSVGGVGIDMSALSSGSLAYAYKGPGSRSYIDGSGNIGANNFTALAGPSNPITVSGTSSGAGNFIVPATLSSQSWTLPTNSGTFAVTASSPLVLNATTGNLTLSTTITAGGPTGSATVAPIITYDVYGRLTAVSSATITPALSSITGLGTGVATFLTTPSSANLAAALTDETGSGAAVFATSPALTTPNIGVATATTVNKVTITAPASAATLTIPDGVTLTGPASSGTAMTLGNTETVTGVKTFGAAGAVGRFKLAGTTSGTTVLDASSTASGTLTLPAATDTLVGKATTDTLTNKTFDTAGTGNSFSINGVAATANTGTGAVARAAAPTFTTPTLGAATATTINGNTFTTGTYTLTGVAGKTLTFNNSLTLAGTDATTLTFQGTDTYVGRATTDTLTNKTFDTAGTGNSFSINGVAATANTGTGSVVRSASPTFTGTVALPALSVTGVTNYSTAATVGGVLNLSGGDGSGAFSTASMSFGFAAGNTFRHWIHTRHDTTAANNAMDFYTNDGTLSGAGIYPTNAVLGLTINNGNILTPGVATLANTTATPAGGSTAARLLFGTTAGFGIYFGSGAPTVSAAQGSLYLRSDGSSTSTRMYVNTNGSTTWTAVTTAA